MPGALCGQGHVASVIIAACVKWKSRTIVQKVQDFRQCVPSHRVVLCTGPVPRGIEDGAVGLDPGVRGSKAKVRDCYTLHVKTCAQQVAEAQGTVAPAPFGLCVYGLCEASRTYPVNVQCSITAFLHLSSCSRGIQRPRNTHRSFVLFLLLVLSRGLVTSGHPYRDSGGSESCFPLPLGRVLFPRTCDTLSTPSCFPIFPRVPSETRGTGAGPTWDESEYPATGQEDAQC